ALHGGDSRPAPGGPRRQPARLAPGPAGHPAGRAGERAGRTAAGGGGGMRRRWDARLLLVLGLLAGLLAGPLGVFPSGALAREPVMSFGLHLGPDPLAASALMPIAGSLGATVAPIEFAWERVQPEPERFAWDGYDFAVRRARTYGLRPVG